MDWIISSHFLIFVKEAPVLHCTDFDKEIVQLLLCTSGLFAMLCSTDMQQWVQGNFLHIFSQIY